MEIKKVKFAKERLDDKNDIVYYDKDNGLYIIKWEEVDTRYIPVRHYIENKNTLNFFERIKKFLGF